MIQVDARGFSCPEPLIRTRQGIKQISEDGMLEILVDTVTSRENVRRYLTSKNFMVEVEDIEDGFKVVGKKEPAK